MKRYPELKDNLLVYRMYFAVFILVVGLSTSIPATPIPNLIDDDPLTMPATTPSVGLGAMLTTRMRADSAEPLCLIHAVDKALLTTGPSSDGFVDQLDEPLLLPGMEHFLQTNRRSMFDLNEIVKSDRYFGEEEYLNVECELDVLPDISQFTPERRHRLLETNRAQLLYDHVNLMASFILALDTVRQDQEQLPIPRLNDSSLEATMSGMCRLLYGIHRILRICGFDVTELQQIHTTPSVDYEPPSQNVRVHERDLVIVREVFNYVNDAAYRDLSDLLSMSSYLDGSTNGIRNCSSLYPQDSSNTTAATATIEAFNISG